MKVVCALLIGVSVASAVPFFGREVLGPEPVFDYAPEVEDPVPFENYEVPPGQAFHFAFQMPQIDLSHIFKPLRLFAGVNLPAILQHEKPRQCDSAKFDLSEEESEVITECQEKDVGGSLLDGNNELRECIVLGLPKSSVELRQFLSREEFALVNLNSAYSISFVDGTFEQKRTITFQMCPKDEVNSIDGELPPEIAPDRIDTAEVVEPVAAVPMLPLEPVEAVEPVDAERPLFQFGIPQLQLPDFNELFQPLFSLVPDLSVPEEEVAVESTELEAPRPPQSGGGGFLSDLFSIFHPPVRTDVDVHDCANKRFEVALEVYEKANECKHADDYKTCLSEGVEENEESEEFLNFASDLEWEIVGSSFTRATFTYIDEVTSRNTIYLKRCRKIELEKASVADESSEEASGAVAEETEMDEDELVPAEVITEEKAIESKIDEQEASGDSSYVPTVPEVEQQEEQEKPVEPTVPEVEETVPAVEKVEEATLEEDDSAKEQLEAEKASSEVERFPDPEEGDEGYENVAAVAEPLKEKPAAEVE